MVSPFFGFPISYREVGCRARHPERAKEDAQILEAVRIVDFARMRPSCSFFRTEYSPMGAKAMTRSPSAYSGASVEHLGNLALLARSCSAGTFGSFVDLHSG